MLRNSSIATLVGAALLGMAVLPLCAQTKSPRKTKPKVEAPASHSRQAEEAIEKRDFATAETLLKKGVTANPKDYQAWYYLGYVYSSTDRRDDAVDAYKKAIEANPKLFEANLNLGLLLASQNNRAEAARYLQAATELKPQGDANESLFRAWFALGRVLTTDDPQGAVTALRRATELQPKNATAYLELGQVLEKQKDYAGAEQNYQQAATLERTSAEAVAGLTNVYMRTNRLAEAEGALRKLIALDPKNAAAHLQLGRVLKAQKKNDEAATEFAAAQQLTPSDPEVLRELAAQQLAAKEYAEAEASFRSLVQQQPKDAELHFGLASALLNQLKYAEAQKEYLQVVQLKPDWGDAYGELAVAANGNKDYMMTLRALAARAKFMEETPGTYFLRATAFDHLKDFQQASENYKQFLMVANGKFPDQEWQARHRLIAIDPETRAKQKK